MSMYKNYSTFNTTLQVVNDKEWGWMIKVIASHVIVAIGLIANSLTVFVMRSPRLRFKSYSHYLSALAVFDSCVLLGQELDMVDEILKKRMDHEGLFVHFSDFSCKIYMFIDTVCNLMSSWLIVVMAVERMCVVYMPFRRNMWCQQKGAVIIILTIFSLLSCTQIFRFVMVGNEHGECLGLAEHENIYVPLHIYVYQFALLFIAPVLIVLVCNIGVLVKIFAVEKETQNEDSSSTRLTGGAHRRSKTTRMLVAISTTYILCTLPLVVLTITAHVVVKREAKRDFFWTKQFLLNTVPWFHILQAVSNINYASNFFIYIMSGKKFRIELRRMILHERPGSSFVGGSSRTRDEIIMM